MDQNNIIECGGFYFIHNFDSGNLGHVERVPTELIAPGINHKTNAPETPDYEFNIWTRPDCAGTEFENGNRTWFYFGVQATEQNVLVRLNLVNLNKQGKMYNQGMAPVTRTLPGKPQWERIRDRPVHSTDDNTFMLSFKYRTADNLKATTFFAFTYPFSFAELQIALNSIDLKMLPLPPPQSPDDIYYYRECLIHSLEGRRVDLLTVSSYHGISTDREEKLTNLFPENHERPFKFPNKKVVFISARVHPGETPSSFVFNGFLNLLLTRNDPVAIQLRKLYVFKMIPFLNPDGVARGHYRTDTRGVNLNRVYLNPSLSYHPTVYASRALIRYYHFGCEKEDSFEEGNLSMRSIQNVNETSEPLETKKKKSLSPYKIGEYGKREKSSKSVGCNKSSTSIKQANASKDKNAIKNTNETGQLADQVYDMKLQEMPSQTSDASSKASDCVEPDPRSLLTCNVLRTCLGSDVHLSTSEELNLQGNNPLRPLRDTLKNSISLLMESSSSVVGDSSTEGKESMTSHVRVGWCAECRRAARRLDLTAPGLAAMLPGYTPDVDPFMTIPGPTQTRSENPKYHTIDEYREHQRQQLDYQQKMLSESSSEEKDAVYFCANCFKRYVVTGLNEEVKISEAASSGSAAVSAHSTGEGDAKPQPITEVSNTPQSAVATKEEQVKSGIKALKKKPLPPPAVSTRSAHKEQESGLYLYIDLHGHASKKGIFMYGNHFEDPESCVECMLLPRIMSLNNLHFHFSSCNFTEKNMYLKDRRDGMSREGSGRVAVLKATGLVRSYTLECNYNTGRLVNVLPPTTRDPPRASPPTTGPPAPPKYTPHIFEEVGKSLGASILDLTGQHPNSRIPCSEHRSLPALRDWLRAHTRTAKPQLTMSRLRPKASSPPRAPLYARAKTKGTDERKENAYVAARTDSERRRSPPVLAQRSGHDIINVNVKFVKKNEPVKSTSRTRYLAENEPKPKTLSTKRRNILAIRKPNSSKTQVGGVVKNKVARRPTDESDGSRPSMLTSKRSFARSIRPKQASRSKAGSSSSSSSAGGTAQWEDAAGSLAAAPSKRRPFPPPPSHLKKIRLKPTL
ncbi:cytosolic carboxypeptidase-like protein 5 isoform X2 [Bombyx mandarina]|uniref:Cytosolic carboxypeptidase-like protein 5 isoform X2 n=1 Tax=Bombyx mandarina TaxID=7092 RepID=A0A6J2JH57_BOMMA|nr:cytosolic carboxypeptidase-like protein 5 isoform X2 [Bombyx mandarina]